jgi:hypothetical protein
MITVSNRPDSRKEEILEAYLDVKSVGTTTVENDKVDGVPLGEYLETINENSETDCAKLLKDSGITIGVLDKKRVMGAYGPTLAYNEWFVDATNIKFNVPEYYN